ncbi:adhesion G-protein coupled receptor G1 isoform X4 [Oreochromis niloticus]|uniref:adhesion G-protein coupled receptor G1 isoform X4 n=1 Tax=Oreochromis niloticus TaxID=8128 RepID=UPI0009055444|nr:adhesion G-protein coupled receptor G1 isoform X4 [Oreochromis niloticus]
MWITLFLFKIICFSMSQAAGGNSFTTQKPLRCGDVLLHCTQSSLSWTRCYEEKIAKCELKTRIFGFSRQTVNSLLEGDLNPTSHHRVYITSSSFEGAATTVMASVINSTYFKNPEISVTNLDAEKLSYITYIGSALSVIFTFISLIIFIWLHRRSPEKAIGLHMQLTGAMFCLHLSFLLCSFWEWLRKNEDSSICLVLGLFLHWSLLATLTWTALEGFQIYLLLIRVFNIYIRRYLLKLCLVGWGFPTFVATICGISGVYGKYTLQLREAKNGNSTAQMCWISSDFQSRRPLVSYITTVAFPLLVVLFNACMLGLVVCKMWKLRSDDKKMNFGSSSDWKEIKKEKRKRLWKDCLTVLGLSCVLGLPWGLASTTYVSLTGIYIFTILNSLQGVFIFLWSVGLARKS